MYFDSLKNLGRKIEPAPALIGLGFKLSMTFFFLQTGLLLAGESLKTEGDDPVGKREFLLSQLSDLESLGHKNDLAIIENLIALSTSSLSLQLFDEASQFLSRALQIQRQSHGLFSPKQIPIILKKMEIDSRAGDWDSVNASLQNLYWLVMNKNVSRGDELIDHLMRLTEFHLKGVADDSEDLRAHHYQQASKISYQSLEIGKRLWEPQDRRLLKLHYSLIKQLYMQAAAVEQGDDTAYALRAIVPGSTWVRPRRIVRSGFYRAGLKLYEGMADVILQGEEDSVETLAMLNLYIADWHLLFDKSTTDDNYTKAIGMLQSSRKDQAALEALLNRPRLLPVPNFFESMCDALEEDLRLNKIKNVQLSSMNMHKIFFQNWSDQMLLNQPFVKPDLHYSREENETNQYQFRFSLNSLDTVAHWVKGRYRSNISVASELQILAGPKDKNLEFIDDQLRLLHFRPRFEGDTPILSEGILIY